ncbi:hypothetical protein IWQ60_005935 [Tieghemiomyces parasiticus]|uniref:TPR-like protein n=1 Tax=Tieghemiomyces parasiticus TaxID=78921 RepID=A0A9W8A5Z3_9FUNG|nr:hypothetical protein IWQ60_005935 [Tieghemiomyces parasiticus]
MQDRAAFHTEVVLAQATELAKQQLNESAEYLCHLIISYSKRSSVATGIQSTKTNLLLAKAHLLLGNVIRPQGQWRRAASQYEDALNLLQPHQGLASIVSADVTTRFLITALHAALCQTYHLLGRPKLALYHLSRVPETERTLALTQILAEASEKLGNREVAIQAQRSLLQRQPYALESIMALARLGVPWDEVNAQLSSGPLPVWLGDLTHVLYASKDPTSSAPESLRRCRALETALFPNNPDLVLAAAHFYQANHEPIPAFYLLSQLHAAYPANVHGMDIYASLMKTQGNPTLISKLADEVRNAHSDSPERWVIMAHYCTTQNQYTRALTFVTKALALRPTYHHALVTQGNLYLALRDPVNAVTSFRQAARLYPDLATQQGLTEAYLDLGRFQDAYVLAKAVHEAAPQHPVAITLLGIVLSQSTETQSRAITLLTDALQRDPKYTEAVIGLASIHVAQKQWEEAIALFTKYLPYNDTGFMRTRYADILTLSGELHQAQIEYNTALSLEPGYEKAKEGLARIEQILADNEADYATDDGESEGGLTDEEGLDGTEEDELDLDADLEEANIEVEYEDLSAEELEDASGPSGIPIDYTPAPESGHSFRPRADSQWSVTTGPSPVGSLESADPFAHDRSTLAWATPSDVNQSSDSATPSLAIHADPRGLAVRRLPPAPPRNHHAGRGFDGGFARPTPLQRPGAGGMATHTTGSPDTDTPAFPSRLNFLAEPGAGRPGRALFQAMETPLHPGLVYPATAGDTVIPAAVTPLARVAGLESTEPTAVDATTTTTGPVTLQSLRSPPVSHLEAAMTPVVSSLPAPRIDFKALVRGDLGDEGGEYSGEDMVED